MSITVSRDEVKGFEKLKTISQIAPIKDRVRFFESKYGCTLGEFKDRIKREKEDFEKWDDYIEWRAYIESFVSEKEKLSFVQKRKTKKIKLTPPLYSVFTSKKSILSKSESKVAILVIP